ncbi:hypothetical protein LJB99_04120 [Deltaproteobacteria bacterium OttesenSCG-928-K17]|nr:hypothetical protein [Deltaproteobacteria bacterium OttesenSCG-928-K17]
MSINNILFSIQNMSPAMLNIGSGKSQNYENLSALSNSLWGGDSGANSLLGSSGTSNTDSVSLTYKNIGDKMISDMAGVTAGVIKQYPELDDDYVIAIIDDGQSREARVYSRKEILENFEGTDEEKAALEKELAANPLMVFNNGSGLPPTGQSAAAKQLAGELNAFLSTNKKTFDVLDKAGFDPLANLLGSSTIKKILANCALPIEVDKKDDEKESAEGKDKNTAIDDSADENEGGDQA